MDIRKSNCKKERELEIEKASSSENEITFYFTNVRDCVFATYLNTQTIIITYQKKYKEEQKNKNNFGKRLVLMLLDFLCVLLISHRIQIEIKNFYEIKMARIHIFIIMVTILYLLEILIHTIVEYKFTSSNVKSKHSAEHQMCNFLTQYKRLPRNILEIEKMSRFSKKCGSRLYMQNGTITYLERICFILIMQVAYSKFSLFYSFIISFIFTFIMEKLIKRGKLNFLINFFQIKTSYLFQYMNTSKKVKKEDVILVCALAIEWIKKQYPEFYCEEDEISLNKSCGMKNVRINQWFTLKKIKKDEV